MFTVNSGKDKLTSLLTVQARAGSGDYDCINILVVWAYHISGTVIAEYGTQAEI
jgi:hypothetical protein